jgi:hypothetical protein
MTTRLVRRLSLQRKRQRARHIGDCDDVFARGQIRKHEHAAIVRLFDETGAAALKRLEGIRRTAAEDRLGQQADRGCDDGLAGFIEDATTNGSQFPHANCQSGQVLALAEGKGLEIVPGQRATRRAAKVSGTIDGD